MDSVKSNITAHLLLQTEKIMDDIGQTKINSSPKSQQELNILVDTICKINTLYIEYKKVIEKIEEQGIKANVKYILNKKVTKSISLSLLQSGINNNDNWNHGKGVQTVITEDIKKQLIKNKVDLDSVDLDGSYLLLKACEDNDLQRIKILLGLGADINRKYIYSDNTMLHIAVMKGYLDIVKFLVANNADLNLQNQSGMTSLHMACLFGNREVVELLVNNGATLDIKDMHGKIPLYYSYGRKEEDSIELLLEKSAKKVIDSVGQTKFGILPRSQLELGRLVDAIYKIDALSKECSKTCESLKEQGIEDKFVNVFSQKVTRSIAGAFKKLGIESNELQTGMIAESAKRQLLKNDIKFDSVDLDGSNLLIKACNDNDLHKIKILLGLGADINRKDYSSNNTMMHIAIKNGNSDIINFLIENHADLNVRNKSRMTALHYACIYGNREIVELLANNGANLNVKEARGKTPLYYACNQKKEDVIDFLIERRADLDVTDDNGATVLLSLMDTQHEFYKYFDIIKKLVHEGANLTIQDRYGSFAWSKVIQFMDFTNLDMYDLASMFFDEVDINQRIYTKNGGKYGLDKRSFLMEVAEANQIDEIEWIVNEGADLYLQDYRGDSAISIMVEKNHPLLLDVLRTLDIDVEKVELNRDKDTLVQIALKNGNLEVAQYLILEKDCDVDNHNRSNTTALHLACEKGYEGIVSLLIARGISVDEVDGKGNTPLHYACKFGKHEIVELLIDGEADQNLVNVDGCTPLRYAFDNLDTKIIEMLTQSNSDPNIVDNVGESPWSKLIRESDFKNPITYKIARMFVESIAKVDINLPVSIEILGHRVLNRTFIMQAAIAGNYNMILEFVKDGADLYLQDENGDSAITIMLGKSYASIPLILESLSIDISKIKPDGNGDTILHIAARRNDYRAIMFLIDNEVSVKEKNIYYETPLEIMLYQSFKNRDFSAFIYAIEQYIDNVEEIFCGIDEVNNISEFENYMTMILPVIINSIKRDENPLDFVEALNNQNIALAIVRELGEQKYKEHLNKLDDPNSFNEFVLCKLDHRHLAHNIVSLPDNPARYKIRMLFDIFNELTGFDIRDKNKAKIFGDNFLSQLPDEFKKYSIAGLQKRLATFVRYCEDKVKIDGIGKGGERDFWDIIERSITNTIRVLNHQSESQSYDKKLELLTHCFSVIDYCANGYSVFERLYYLNNNQAKTLEEDIYFQLSNRRRDVLMSLVPRHPQSIHFIQNMLQILSKYNIPERSVPDLYSNELIAFDIDASFKKRYLEGMVADIKLYLKSNAETRNAFFSYLNDRGMYTKRKSLKTEIQDSIEGLLKRDSQAELTSMQKDLVIVTKQCGLEVDDLCDPEVSSKIIESYLDPVLTTQGDFEQIMKFGNAAFEKLDPLLAQSVEELGMRDKLDYFKVRGVSLTVEQFKQKQRILEKYMEIKFPQVIEIDEKEVLFLLKNLGVLQRAEIADKIRDNQITSYFARQDQAMS